jgi:glycine/D-amino acid oxidase-like deaminating enzyme
MAERFDVAVIGGGVIGASVAFHLTKLGCKRVVLIERGQLATGATSRSSGLIRTHYSVPVNVTLARASLAVFERLGEVLDDPEAACGFAKPGYIIVAPPGAGSDAVRRSIGMQKEHGVDCRLLDRGEAKALHPWLALEDVDAIGYEAEAGFADPYLTTTSFARAARRGGATIRLGTPVTGLLRSGSRITGVRTANGDIVAGTVVSAMNVWSGAIAGWAGIEIPLSISRHHIASFEVDAPYTAALPVVKDLASASKLYLRSVSGSQILVGTGEEGDTIDDPDTPDADIALDWVAEQGAQLAHRMPRFAEGRFVTSWSGLYDTTPDWNPVLGPAPGLDGLLLAFGFSGHGFKLSPAIGRMLAEAALGATTTLPLAPYRLTRFAEGELLLGAYGPGAVS